MINKHLSSTSPLRLDNQSCESDIRDNMIKFSYENNCDIENSNDSHSTRRLSTNSDELRMVSEFFHPERDDINNEEDIKEVVVVEDKGISGKETPTSKNKKEKIMKEVSKVNSMPSSKWKVFGRTNNMKFSSPKPPMSKNNVAKTSKNLDLGFPPYKEKNLKDQNSNVRKHRKKGTSNLNLGIYLLKKAMDQLTCGDNIKKALDYTLRAKESFESCSLDETNLGYIKCLHLLASIYYSMGQQNEAIPILELSIEVATTELGHNHALAKFVGCMRLGDIYAIKGKIDKSILYYRLGLEIQKDVHGEQDPHFGETCRYVAEAHVQAFDFDKAEKFCQMALDIHKEANYPISIEEAADRRLMGLICDSKGNHEAALEHYTLASTSMRIHGHGLDVAVIDCNIGDAYLSLARYDEAIFSYQKALSTYKSFKEENSPDIALVHVRLAELYNKVGMFGDSKLYCEKALQIYNKFPCGSSIEDVASGLIDISAIYESMNELDQSLLLLHQAQDMYGDAPTHQYTIGGIEAQMGLIYYMLENYVDSYNYLKSSISRFQTSGDKKCSLCGIILNQLGLSCVKLFALSEATMFFEEARNILDGEYGSHHPDTIEVCSNLAATYDALGRRDEAIDLLEFVVGMREEKLGTADPVVDDEKKRLSEVLKEANRARRRKCTSLETLLD